MSPVKIRRLIALCSGLLLPLAFAPFDLFWLAPISVAALFFLWEEQTPREAAVIGLFFGFGVFSLGTYWLYISLRQLGGAPIPVVVLLMFGLVFAMGFFFALKGWLQAKLLSNRPLLHGLFVLPAVWVLIEWLRGWVLTGFPWLSLGYSQLDNPLRAWSLVGGVYGTSLTVALLAGVLLILVRRTSHSTIAAMATLVVLAAGTWVLQGQRWTNRIDTPLSVSLIQAAIPQEQKWLIEQREPTLELYKTQTLALHDKDLVIWPEAAIPALPYEVMPFLTEIDAEMQSRGTQLFTGILSFDTDTGEYRNTLMGLGPALGVYNKRHLVPFGEYFPVPAFVTQWLRLMNLPSEDITPGADIQEPLYVGKVPVAPTICYEVAFGAEQRVFLPEAQLLVNVSNDTWFGDSIAPHQHLQMARMRALETGRPMLRATNTGITAVINADGIVEQTIPQFVPGVLSAEVYPETGATPYVRWGNAPVVLLSLLIIAISAVTRFRASGSVRQTS